MKGSRKFWLILSGFLFMAALAIAYFSFPGFVKQDSAQERLCAFLSCLKDGKLAEARKSLGSEGCACSPPGGWSAYLNCRSSLEPNLAFLIGTGFLVNKQDLGEPFVDPVHKNVIHRPAHLQLSFPAASRPYLLPVKLAFGSDMNLAELDSFASDPGLEGLKGLTLRLRPRLGPGSIAPDPVLLSKEPESESEQKDSLDSDSLTALFGTDAALILFPKDDARVRKSDGSILSTEELAAHLPRLSKLDMTVDLVCKKGSKVWKVFKCKFDDPQIDSPQGKQIALKDSSSTL